MGSKGHDKDLNWIFHPMESQWINLNIRMTFNNLHFSKVNLPIGKIDTLGNKEQSKNYYSPSERC